MEKKTHCKNGHPRIPENIAKSGNCRLCSNERCARSRKNPHMRQYWRDRQLLGSTKSLASSGKFSSISKTASVLVVELSSIPPSGKRNLVLTTTTRQESFVVYCVTPAIAGLGC